MRVAEVSRLHVSRRGRRPRHAGGAGAAQGRVAVAAGWRPQGGRAQLRGGAQAVGGLLSRRKRAWATSVWRKRISTRRRRISIARSSPILATCRRSSAAARRFSGSAIATWRSRASKPPSWRTRASAALRTPHRGASRARAAGRCGGRERRPRPDSFDEARRALRSRDRRVAGQPVPLSRSSPMSRGGKAISTRRLRQAQKAAELDPTDARAQVLIGEIYEARKDSARAVAAYEAALALEPNEAMERKIETLRESAGARGDADGVPGDRDARRCSRASSWRRSSACGWTISSSARHAANAVVITDTRGSWAVPWILSVTRAGVMEVYPNHTFQPAARRPPRRPRGGGEPRAVAHRGARSPRWRRRGATPSAQFADVPPAHLSYPAASVTRRGRRHAAARRRQLPAVEAGDRRRSRGGREEARRARRERHGDEP